MLNKLRIYRGTTAMRVRCSTDGRFRDVPHISSHPFLSEYLTEREWDFRFKRTVVKYHHFKYDPETGLLTCPAYMTGFLISFMRRWSVECEVIIGDPNPYVTTDIKYTGSLVPRENQLSAIEFLTEDADDKPMRALSLATGCLTGDTVINFNRAKNGFQSTLKNAYIRFNQISDSSEKLWDRNIKTFVRSFTGSGIELHEINNIVYSGIKPVYLVKLENGLSIKGTYDHRIMTSVGMVPIKHILNKDVMCDTLHAKPSDAQRKDKQCDTYIQVPDTHPFAKRVRRQLVSNRKFSRVVIHRLVYEAVVLNKLTLSEFRYLLNDAENIKHLKFVNPTKHSIHHINFDHYNNAPDNLELLTHEEHSKLHGNYSYFNQGVPKYSKAVSVGYVGEEDTYDICCNEPHHNFVANGMVVHNSGKSLIALLSIIKLQRRALIVLPANLVDQWTKVIGELSTAKVGIIRGNQTIYDIVGSNYQIDSDIILTSIKTLQEYALGGERYRDAPSLQSFIRGLKVGIKVVDECHLNFNANLMVDIQSDVDRNIYLSATHVRGSLASKTIFNRVYPTEIRLGELAVSDHINVTEVRYNIGEIDKKRISTDRGYSQVKYEKYLLQQMYKFEKFIGGVLKPIVREYFIRIRKINQKLLILVGRVDFAELLVRWLKEDFSEVSSEGYFNNTSDEVLHNSDIIVSTVGSCGTGRDIKGLRTLILFTSFSSEPLIYQTIGRLRKMEDTPEFLYLVNAAIPAQINHARAKQLVYKARVKDFRRIDL